MEIFYSPDIHFFKCGWIATVGFFDGVHAGHRFLIEELKREAKVRKLKSVVFTFAQHPRKTLHSDFQPQLITTLNEKLFQLESTGIDACVVLDFTEEMSKLSAFEFLRNLLNEQYHVMALLVGHDHRFGHNRAEGFPEYQIYGNKIGMDVIQATKFSTNEFSHISSSEIRHALTIGDVQKAKHLLSYSYSFSGQVIDGFKVGSKIGFPTANIKCENEEKLIPAIGVYAVEIEWKTLNYKGMMNIGLRPTLENGNNISLEVNIFDFNENIYNETIKVSFIEKIRNEIKFNNIEGLIEQLKIDKLKVMKILQS